MSFVSPVHIAFFAAVALLALGPRRFPEFTKTLGNTLREFREVMNGASAVRPVEGAGPAEGPPPAAPDPAAVPPALGSD